MIRVKTMTWQQNAPQISSRHYSPNGNPETGDGGDDHDKTKPVSIRLAPHEIEQLQPAFQ
jgi:hypothetical protein